MLVIVHFLGWVCSMLKFLHVLQNNKNILNSMKSHQEKVTLLTSGVRFQNDLTDLSPRSCRARTWAHVTNIRRIRWWIWTTESFYSWIMKYKSSSIYSKKFNSFFLSTSHHVGSSPNTDAMLANTPWVSKRWLGRVWLREI